ncbi:hypothetical protein FB45DRAFT_1078296 [Roridomyces roridus]|uniref:Uncharacterized protein n=1 Tax=Roridomyces roridus TaxID=1738132 RepID=A0AAD7CKC6_9AGAR|nr:hypothetical protein FB45DRAFT_1078296 [Roridomyces roridus]
MASAPSSAPSLDVNSTLGALQIGVLVSCMLFGFSTNQTYLYYSRFQADDPPKIKYLALRVGAFHLYRTYPLHHDSIGRLAPGTPEQRPPTVTRRLFSFQCDDSVMCLSKKPYIPVLTWTLSILFLLGTLVTFITGLENHDLTLNETRWSWLYPSLWSIAAANDLIIAGALVFWFRSQRKEVPHAQVDSAVD